ncbi:HAD hydrolase-like protein [Rhizobium changzhiense]|uniref:HAD-IIA family hydrolase n=1 Tax=Rhizobium changzhiense TaxID=2692317 RepID=UPI001F0BDE24|nr:HAD hydrolase-like protein [Rhizobium changzhiense]MCH4547458.1 HAD hydrolase-like protein [Rhizobium changzhiense]
MQEPLLDAAGYLIDLDGTLISGRTVLPDALWLLEEVRGRFAVVSNNAEHTPKQLARMLRTIGLPINEQDLILAGTTAIDLIAADLPEASIMLLGSAALIDYARAKGLRVGGSAPDLVLVTRDRHFTYAKLAAASEAIAAGAALFVAAPDGSHPGVDGRPVPETGALAAAILASTGLRDYTVIGKPERMLFERGCCRIGVAPSDAVMIGDNPGTDGLGARRLGMRFLQVERGIIRRSRLLAAPSEKALA